MNDMLGLSEQVNWVYDGVAKENSPTYGMNEPRHAREVSSNKIGAAEGDRPDEYGRRSVDNCCAL
ncbi:MAG TPA: hypothetical protein VFX32_01305, partial [Pseudolabrys sp.]|nr:hypothetical protein [Pseudolabrys sp.]